MGIGAIEPIRGKERVTTKCRKATHSLLLVPVGDPNTSSNAIMDDVVAAFPFKEVDDVDAVGRTDTGTLLVPMEMGSLPCSCKRSCSGTA